TDQCLLVFPARTGDVSQIVSPSGRPSRRPRMPRRRPARLWSRSPGGPGCQCSGQEIKQCDGEKCGR
ncbi:hypothetical protein A2U01_0112639, partial [Trifolium medium]|nr:hypothetical protein [Trifolium medium]